MVNKLMRDIEDMSCQHIGYVFRENMMNIMVIFQYTLSYSILNGIPFVWRSAAMNRIFYKRMIDELMENVTGQLYSDVRDRIIYRTSAWSWSMFDIMDTVFDMLRDRNES